MLPGISQLLIDSALDPDLRRRVLESPDEVFPHFDLSEEEKDVLRRPDHRLMQYLGAALGQKTTAAPVAASPAPHAVIQAAMLPDIAMVLTVVPCARYENEQLQSISYAVWVNPLPSGVDPAALPPPPGASIPGTALTPLHAVIQLNAIQLQDAEGKPQVGLSASFRQSTNMVAPTLQESPRQSEALAAAANAVKAAAAGARYSKLLDLIHTLQAEAPQ
jgi:hypothetical protein